MTRSEFVTVQSSETGLVFPMARHLAEQHDTLTALEGDAAREAVATSDYEQHDYRALQRLIGERNEGRDADTKIPAAGTKAELIAALVADDTREKE